MSERTQRRVQDLGRRVGELVARKNRAYGSSFAKAGAFLRLLYPRGLAPAQFDDALVLARIFDKCMRIATRKRAFGESPYLDLAGYGLLGAAKDQGSSRRSLVPSASSGQAKNGRRPKAKAAAEARRRGGKPISAAFERDKIMFRVTDKEVRRVRRRK